jgi:AcrR family transcriptional regulator
MRDDPPRRLTRAEAKLRTRELLLDSAARTFARKGFTGASVEEIAESAGFSIGALYSNFSNKEQLFLELLSARANSRITTAAEILEQARHDDTNAASALGRMLVEVADKDVDFAPLQAEFWLYAVRNPEVLDQLTPVLRAPRDALGRLIEASRQRPGSASRIPVDNMATVVFALFQGLVRQRRLDPESVPPQLFGQALHWLFTGLEETR